MKNRSETFKISIVIPVFNEQENIRSLAEVLVAELNEYNCFEIIFVDDGSKDDSKSVITEIAREFEQVYYISFSRNFGHQNALRAGIDMSSGDVVITMDGDHQHPPELLHDMVAMWKRGYDVVFTVREDIENVSKFKQVSANIFYSLLNKISDIDLKRGTADFRLIDKRVVHSLRRFRESDIFYRGIFAWLGFKQCELSYVPGVRAQGDPKYTFKKMAKLAVDGISSFSLFPLRLAAITGLIVASISFLYVLYALYIKMFTDEAVAGWFSIMAGIYFLSGLQLLFFGICGEYIGRIYMEVKNRPNYLVSDTNLNNNSTGCTD